MGYFTTPNGTAQSGTTYHQKNDSTYIWGTPSGAHGEIYIKKNQPSEYYWYNSSGDRLPIEDPEIQKNHYNNIQYLKQNNMFDTNWNRMKNFFKSLAPTEGWIPGLGTFNQTSDIIKKTPISMKSGGSVKCAECGDKMKKKKLVKKHQAGNAFKDLVNKSYSNITIPNHGAGAMGLEGVDRAYNQYKNTLGKEAAGDWKFNALGSLLTGAALGPLAIPTGVNSALIPTYSTLMVKSLIPDDTATAKKRKEVQPIPTELENSTLQQILDLPKELLDNIAGYVAPSLIENKKKNETTRGSKTGTNKTRK